MILGFPCNQFGKPRNPAPNEDILKNSCTENYGVNVRPMFSKIDVNGDAAAPLYKFLTSEQHRTRTPQTERSSWNFEKFLVDEEGNVVRRFGTKVTPEEIAPQI